VDPGRAPSGEPRRGGELRLIRPGSRLGDFNPSEFAVDWQIPASYLEPLLRPDPSTLRPEPWLARHWEWRDGGQTIALFLRDDVYWHDGTPLTATDATFSFDVYKNDIASAVSSLFELTESAEAVSDHEIVVRFAERDANWLFNGATLPLFAHHQYGSFWQRQPEGARTLSGFDWSESTPVGTGPWQVAEWDSTAIKFTRFGHYWGDETWLDALEIGVQPGVGARLRAWSDEKSALLWPVRFAQLSELDSDEGEVYPAPAPSVMFAAFNFANPAQPAGSLWNDIRVRRAASMAIDRERYAAEVFGGFIRWDAAGTVSQPWANDSELVNPTHAPESAATLLGEAGWLDYDGDGVREDATGVQLRPVAILRNDSRPELAAVMARVARDLVAVGIALTVEALPPAEFDRRRIETRDFDLIAYAYDQLPGFTDSDLYGSAWDIRTNPAGWNPGGYVNAEADAAIEQFLSAVSIERQGSALKRLQRAADDDLFGLWLGFPMDLIVVADGVEGFVPDMAWQTLRTWQLWRSAE
jgi:peptide/nickel transport system substrate-binding protein